MRRPTVFEVLRFLRPLQKKKKEITSEIRAIPKERIRRACFSKEEFFENRLAIANRGQIRDLPPDFNANTYVINFLSHIENKYQITFFALKTKIFGFIFSTFYSIFARH